MMSRARDCAAPEPPFVTGSNGSKAEVRRPAVVFSGAEVLVAVLYNLAD